MNDVNKLIRFAVLPGAGYMTLWDVGLGKDHYVTSEMRKDDYYTAVEHANHAVAPLLDSVKVPRACIKKSIQFPNTQYYVGQKTVIYRVWWELYDQALLVSNQTDLTLRDGSSASDFAIYNHTDFLIYIFTEDQEQAGIRRLVLRD